MCVDFATLALAGQIVGGVVSAVGAAGQVASNNAIANYQADVARINETIAKNNAREIEKAGVRKEQEEVWKVRGFAGRQRAAQAASGLDVNSGSPAAVAEGTRMLGNRSIANVNDGTRRAAYNQRVIGTGFENEARLQAAQGNESSLLPVMGSLLGTASSVGKSFIDFKNSGVPMDGLELIF